MHITRYTDYSLRVMIYVALQDDKLCTIQEIASAYNVSKNHLMKVVQRLNNSGYIKSVRGKNGGLRLGRAAASINIGELVREMEQDLALVECQQHQDSCVITPACQLKNIFQQALDAFFHVLDQYTLAELLEEKNRTQLLNLLNIE
ncbi:Rrf2 family transcriptional regulator [Teredinibacter franksiae]|uniref:Rrf2 family transcriptional regulator n=1 Tax=Teredinibacter franksiae TaxID=2761453 RepID=UPI001629193A|nr:Rrf2 family transcriptional regulator [Teredinibacter franksiae]